MNKKKILVLGSGGQLGKFLSSNLKLNRYKIKIFKSENYKINLLSLRKNIKKINKINPNMIINCSAYTDVDGSESKKNIAKKLNFENLKLLREYCDSSSTILLHFSTDYVFDGKNKFYEPSDRCKPINYYGYTKYLGEKEILKSKNKFFIFRISWLLSSHKKSFLKKIYNKIKKKKKFSVISDAYSCPTSVIFINNFLKRNIKSLFEKKLKGIFHLTSPTVLSYYELAKFIEKNSFRKNYNIVNKAKFNEYKTIAKRPRISKLGLRKTKKIFIIPKNSWKSDIQNLLK